MDSEEKKLVGVNISFIFSTQLIYGL